MEWGYVCNVALGGKHSWGIGCSMCLRRIWVNTYHWQQWRNKAGERFGHMWPSTLCFPLLVCHNRVWACGEIFERVCLCWTDKTLSFGNLSKCFVQYGEASPNRLFLINYVKLKQHLKNDGIHYQKGKLRRLKKKTNRRNINGCHGMALVLLWTRYRKSNWEYQPFSPPPWNTKSELIAHNGKTMQRLFKIVCFFFLANFNMCLLIIGLSLF